MRLLLSMVLMLALTAAAPASRAEDQMPILRCLIATGLLSQSNDKTAAIAGTMGSMYWLGRLDPALSESEIERRLAAISTKLTRAEIVADLPRCGKEMQQRGDMMQRIGEKLKQDGTKPDTH